MGILNKVLQEKKPYYTDCPTNDVHYNPHVDIDSTLPTLTYPILKNEYNDSYVAIGNSQVNFNNTNKKTSKFGEVLAIIQTDVWSKTLSPSRTNNFEKMSGTIFSLMEKLSVVLRKSIMSNKSMKDLNRIYSKNTKFRIKGQSFG